MNISQLLQKNILLFDGGMGTMLQQAGMAAGELPELWNITHPEKVTAIHRQYVQAGADIIKANTFQASPLKLGESCNMEDVIAAGIANAKAAGAKLVALDIGPLGQLLEPMGTLSFEKAYDIYAKQMICGEKNGADIILIETVSDLYEAKAAVLAAKENTSLPVFCTLTFQEDGRTFVGCDPVSAAVTLSGLGADVLGVNCSLGPKELMPVVEQLLEYSSVPVMVQANAGLPQYINGETVYVITPEEFAEYAAEMAEKGVAILGGCCGTTPEFIRCVKKAVSNTKRIVPERKNFTAVCSGSKTVFLDDGITVIGERINPTGKKKLKEAIRSQKLDYILGEAINQTQAGSDVLDVNVGLPEIDEPQMMVTVVKQIQAVVNTPLQIDSAATAAIEAGVRAYNGKPIINSVNGKQKTMEEIFPIAKKYGAVVVGLTLDEDGIPPTAQGRLEIARRIVSTALRYCIPKSDILIDCLVLTASAQQDQVMATLDAIKLVKSELGVKTALGVSNVSFGLPSRERLNAAFLAAAFGAGLNAPILNPMSAKYMEIVDSFRVLNNEDRDAANYIEKYAGEKAEASAAPIKKKPAVNKSSEKSLDLMDIILQGRKTESAAKVTQMLESMPALEIVNKYFIPALDIVGDKFEKGTIFLPQLMQSADTVKNGFDVIKAHMDESGEKPESRGKILMATVHGDIHDIGKNIVCMILENYGFEVIDLGKDVPAEKIIETVKRENIRLVGLSALMTTTVQSMKETIALAKKEGLDCAFFVGGAVLNTEYTKFVGADFYARDAMASVEIAGRFFE